MIVTESPLPNGVVCENSGIFLRKRSKAALLSVTLFHPAGVPERVTRVLTYRKTSIYPPVV